MQDANTKLEEAEREKLEMAKRVKQREKPVLRLAQHLPDDGNFVVTTHRGEGAIIKKT